MIRPRFGTKLDDKRSQQPLEIVLGAIRGVEVIRDYDRLGFSRALDVLDDGGTNDNVNSLSMEYS